MLLEEAKLKMNYTTVNFKTDANIHIGKRNKKIEILFHILQLVQWYIRIRTTFSTYMPLCYNSDSCFCYAHPDWLPKSISR